MEDFGENGVGISRANRVKGGRDCGKLTAKKGRGHLNTVEPCCYEFLFLRSLISYEKLRQLLRQSDVCKT